LQARFAAALCFVVQLRFRSANGEAFLDINRAGGSILACDGEEKGRIGGTKGI